MPVSQGLGEKILNTFGRNSHSAYTYPINFCLFRSAVNAPVDPFTNGSMPAGAAGVPTGEIPTSGGTLYARVSLATPFGAVAAAGDPSTLTTNGAIAFAESGATWADGVSLWVNGWGIYDSTATPLGLWHGALNLAKAVLALDTVTIASGGLILRVDPST